MNPVLSMTFPPQWSEMEGLRAQSTSFLSQHGLAQDAIDAVTMVVCELAENAMKYGQFKGASTGLEVSLEMGARMITVEVKNPMGSAQQEDLSRLDRMIQWIRGYQDPFQAYLERLKVVSAQSLDNGESGLGLVRIAYEGQSIIDFFVDEDNVLTVCAVFYLQSSMRRAS